MDRLLEVVRQINHIEMVLEEQKDLERELSRLKSEYSDLIMSEAERINGGVESEVGF